MAIVAASYSGRGQAQETQNIKLKSVELTVLKSAEKNRFLAAHNAARKAVGVSPLAWSEELSAYALDSLAEQKDRLIEEAKEGWRERRIVIPDHRLESKHGENIAGWAAGSVGASRIPTAERAVTWWLEEKQPFDKLNADGSFKYGDQEGKTDTDAEGKEQPVVIGHYTAIVWKTTTHLGAAKLTFQLADDRGLVRTYVAIICNYDPPGNIRGQKPF